MELGKLVSENEHRRDAIHIAMAPVTAPTQLVPGQHVDANGNPDGKHVGIVDPFLTKPIKAGERFWLCLYPDTVTGIRHIWSHPAFGVK